MSELYVVLSVDTATLLHCVCIVMNAIAPLKKVDHDDTLREPS